MINVAIIGAGSIAKNFHLPAWNKINGIRIVGIVDKNLSKAKLLAKKYKSAKCYKKMSLLFKNEKVDAVDICTPNSEHEKQIIFSLNNNKHVICEKPFVLKFKAFKKIYSLAKKKKLICVCAQHQRFRQPSIEIKKIVDQKKLGLIYTAHISAIFKRSKTVNNSYFTSKTKSGGGPLVDLGSHFIDLAWWIMGNPKPVSAFVYGSNALARYLKKNEKNYWKKFDVEDYSYGCIRFKGNKSITFQLSYLLNTNRDIKKIEFFGTKAGVQWPEVKLTRIKNNITRTKLLFSTEKNLASIIELKHFIKSIKKKVIQKPTLLETGYMVKIIDASIKAMREKKEVLI